MEEIAMENKIFEPGETLKWKRKKDTIMEKNLEYKQIFKNILNRPHLFLFGMGN